MGQFDSQLVDEQNFVKEKEKGRQFREINAWEKNVVMQGTGKAIS